MSATLTHSEFATQLSAHGFRLFKCIRGGKRPATKRWPKVATNDPDQVRRWFSDNVHNIGIYAGERIVGGNVQHMVVLDLDVKGGHDGIEALRALAAPHGGMPVTLTVQTPSGGQHHYLRASRPVGNNASQLAPGIDVRGMGGFVVGPCSEVDGGAYTVVNDPDEMADCPDWLEALLPHPGASSAVDRGRNRQPLPGVDPDRAMKRAIEYLATAPEAVEGAGGDATTYAVAAKLLALGLDEAAAVDLMLSDYWFDGCGWTPEAMATKVRHAAQYMQDPIGADAPEAQFERVAETEPNSAPDTAHPFDELNKSWTVVAEPPNTVVYRVYENSTTGQQQFERYTREGFFGLLAHRKFDGAPLAAKWWESPRRRTYSGGIDFAPGKTLAADCLNTWGGFAVQPAPGDWSLMRTHIRSVICSDDPAIDAYVMGWLARLVQRPGEPGQVALVLRGGRGTGKGTLGEMLGKIFGVHGLHIGSAQRLTGNFNGHLMGKVYLLADEAFFAGKRADESTLKMLITERALDLEQKYQAARNVRNCLHILMASNESWVVPAGPLERRFCVIDISESQQQNNVYFGKIREQMDAGGLSAMLHDLLAYDLAGFDVWNVPNTQAGTEQRADSLRGPERWLFDALAEGRIAGQDWTADGVQVHKDTAYADYRMRARDMGEHTPSHSVGFWKRVSNVLAAGGIQPKDERLRNGVERTRVRIMPSIGEARSAFDAWLGGTPTDWGET